MGNESSNSGAGCSSLGDYSNLACFGEAFKAAHARAGPGHTFTYNGKLYSTNCADGGDYRTKPNNYERGTHIIHQKLHEFNKVVLKDNGLPGLERLKGANWSAGVDQRQAEFHRIEAQKCLEQSNKVFSSYKPDFWGPKF